MSTLKIVTRCSENPHEFVESSLHHEKMGICRGISRKKIVGLFFFETTINTARHQEMIQGFIATLDVEDRFCEFQQDGATAHTATPTVVFLNDKVFTHNPTSTPAPKKFVEQLCMRCKGNTAGM